MSLDKTRLSRWLGRTEAPVAPVASKSSMEPEPIGADWYLLLDEEGRVQSISPSLLLRLGLAEVNVSNQRLISLLLPNSALVVEGEPRDWQGHMLDLDFDAGLGHTLQARGWVQARGPGWMVQRLGSSDLMEEASAA